MGIKTNLRKVFDFIYKAELDNELTENEFDHVFYGLYNEDPIINTEEADDFKWIDMETLNNDIIVNGGVILAGILVYFLKSKWPDLIIGGIVFTFVMRGAIKILKISK